MFTGVFKTQHVIKAHLPKRLSWAEPTTQPKACIRSVSRSFPSDPCKEIRDFSSNGRSGDPSSQRDSFTHNTHSQHPNMWFLTREICLRHFQLNTNSHINLDYSVLMSDSVSVTCGEDKTTFLFKRFSSKQPQLYHITAPQNSQVATSKQKHRRLFDKLTNCECSMIKRTV